MSNVLFIRADGNEHIGLGHVMRSMTIAAIFREAGYDCIYISSAPVKRELFELYGFPVLEVDYPYNIKSTQEAYEICHWLREKHAKYLLIDSYFVTDEYLHILQDCTQLICMSSTKDKLRTNFLINDSLACDRDYFTELYFGCNTKLLLGSEYTPIRNEFCNRDYSVKEKVRQIFITTGGSDSHNFMTQFLNRVKVEPQFSDMQFLFVSGGCNSYYEMLCEEANQVQNAIVVSDVDNMAELMLKSDIAIAAGGTTMSELAVLGIPAIGIAVAHDQVVGLEVLNNIGAIRYAGKVTDSHFWDNILCDLKELVSSTHLRWELSVKSKKCIDGKGAERIYQQIELI